MGATVLHKYASTIAESGSGGATGIVGPNEWNDQHAVYFDVDTQTGTSYTIDKLADLGALVLLNNASAVAVTLGQPVSSSISIGLAIDFHKGWFCFARNIGAGQVTITPTSSTINGQSSFVLNKSEACLLVSDGANWWAIGFDKMVGTADTAMSGDQTVTSLSTSQNDWALTNLSSKTIFHIGATAAVNVTGIAAGEPGQLIVLINESAFAMTFVANSASSAAGHRFLFPANVVLGQYKSLTLWYDPTNSAWRQWAIGAAGAGDLVSTNNLSDVANAATALSNLGGAPLASPTFTGAPAGPTPTTGDNTTKLATTAFVQAEIAATSVEYSGSQSLTTGQQSQARANIAAGTVTSVNSGTGLTGGGFTTSGTLSLANITGPGVLGTTGSGSQAVSTVKTPVLLNTITASSSNPSDTTSLILPGYRSFEIRVYDLLPNTQNVSVYLQYYVGGFQATGYQSAVFEVNSVNTNGTSSPSGNQVGIFLSAPSNVNNSAPGISGTLHIMNPSKTTSPVVTFGTVASCGTGAARVSIASGYWATNGAVTGFQFAAASGTFASGTVEVWGIP